MKLNITKLEDRCTPVINAVGDFGNRNGYQYTMDNRDFVPFPDFMASQFSAYADGYTVVGAAPGGGPRVQIRDANLNVTADFFAFDPSFRGGVHVATDGTNFVVGADVGGGPVVAVFDKLGNETARFFAYDTAFRGGVSVGIINGEIVTTPQDGGSPLVRWFDFHGAQLDQQVYGSINDRSNYSVIAGDVTWDGVPDVSVVDNTNHSININNIVHVGTSGAAYVGYNVDTFELGVGYKRAKGIWGGFDSLEILNMLDGAAGNPNPPITQDWRPGVYYGPKADPGVGGGPVSYSTATSLIAYSGEKLAVPEIGQGSQYAAMADATGQEYVVTASHVVGNPQSNRPIDGYGTATIVTPISLDAPYSVDAAAIPASNVNKGIYYNGKSYSISGFRIPQSGDLMVSVGRGVEFGLGIFQQMQVGTAPVDFGYASPYQIENQYIVGPTSEIPLGVPGYSGSGAFVLTQDGQFYLAGMVVAGDYNITYVTPNAAIEAATGLHVVIK
jgi:hypothetical protein